MTNLPNEDFLLTEKLRNEDPEQFYTLVRMHLSFVLDLNADECDGNPEKKNKVIKWNLPFSKKQKICTKNGFDGPILTLDFIQQMKPIIEFLSKEENISQEGIFRRSGKITRQQELKQLLHQGALVDFDNSQFSVHDCATVLKNILSELPESVLTDAHFPAYCQIAEFCDGKSQSSNERLLTVLQLLILLLPNENRKFFQEIIELLNLASRHEQTNRMSAENLATLFTPHLLCPRKLSPEALHLNSQVMSRVVAFMIQKGSDLFEIPPTVATDVRAYWNKKEKRKLSPLKQMNESICDGTAASTVFAFVDREKTAEENRTNPTVTALAQLYAHIQSLPESSKKRKLIKQFNKENGYGTPLRSASGKKRTRALNLGDSIKKHLSGFSKPSKRNANQGGPEVEDDDISSPSCTKKFQNEIEEKPCRAIRVAGSHRAGKMVASKRVGEGEDQATDKAATAVECSSREDSVETTKSGSKRSLLLSSSASTSVSLSSSSSASSPPSQDHLTQCKSSRLSDDFVIPRPASVRPGPRTSDNDRRLVSTRISDPATPSDPGHSLGLSGSIARHCPNTPGYPSHRPTNTVATEPRPSNSTNRVPGSHGPRSSSSFLMATSTPAPNAAPAGSLLTPIVDKNNSMSPITKSTRRMPKAMQETMMTPRSRKPVISLSGTDLASLVNSKEEVDEDGDCDGDDYHSYGGRKSQTSHGRHNLGKKLIMEDLEDGEGHDDSLSSPFRNYLFTRSVLTASPVDLSFSSRADDFLSVSEKNSSVDDDDDDEEDPDDFKSLPEILHDGAGLSESLLYCLDGNEPTPDIRRKKLVDCSCSSTFSDDSVCHVYETAL